jgi:hypothetical protein
MALPDNGRVLVNWRELRVGIETRNLGLDPPMVVLPHTYKVRGNYLVSVVVVDENGQPWAHVGTQLYLSQNRAVYLTLWRRRYLGDAAVGVVVGGRAVTLSVV